MGKNDQRYLCYTADKFESGRNILSQGKVIEKSGKLRLKNDGHPVLP